MRWEDKRKGDPRWHRKLTEGVGEEVWQFAALGTRTQGSFQESHVLLSAALFVRSRLPGEALGRVCGCLLGAVSTGHQHPHREGHRTSPDTTADAVKGHAVAVEGQPHVAAPQISSRGAVGLLPLEHPDLNQAV